MVSSPPSTPPYLDFAIAISVLRFTPSYHRGGCIRIPTLPTYSGSIGSCTSPARARKRHETERRVPGKLLMRVCTSVLSVLLCRTLAGATRLQLRSRQVQAQVPNKKYGTQPKQPKKQKDEKGVEPGTTPAARRGTYPSFDGLRPRPRPRPHAPDRGRHEKEQLGPPDSNRSNRKPSFPATLRLPTSRGNTSQPSLFTSPFVA